MHLSPHACCLVANQSASCAANGGGGPAQSPLLDGCHATQVPNDLPVLNLFAPVKDLQDRAGLVFGGAVDAEAAAELVEEVTRLFPSKTPRRLLGLPAGRDLQSFTKEELKRAHRKKMMTEHPDRGGSAERKRLVDLALSVLSDPRAIEGWRHCGWPGVHAIRRKREEGASTLVDRQPHAQPLPRFAVVAHPDGRATVVPIAELQLIESERERFESSRPLLLPPVGKLFNKATFVDSPMEASITFADAQMQPPVEVRVARRKHTRTPCVATRICVAPQACMHCPR